MHFKNNNRKGGVVSIDSHAVGPLPDKFCEYLHRLLTKMRGGDVVNKMNHHSYIDFK